MGGIGIGRTNGPVIPGAVPPSSINLGRPVHEPTCEWQLKGYIRKICGAILPIIKQILLWISRSQSSRSY